ncbi:HEPN domain-containing protein [Candidatus Saganbacteria bacterium]|nr:HEPN domain-containing protein [Candidatus Saganbacteria bacterium]
MAPDSLNFEDWFLKAGNEIKAADGIFFYYEDPPTDMICYHAQQAAEKTLKAFLIYKSELAPKTHDLVELVNLCIKQDKDFLSLKELIEVLNKYYIESKYPPDNPIIYSKDEAKSAIALAKNILKFSKSKVSKGAVLR